MILPQMLNLESKFDCYYKLHKLKSASSSLSFNQATSIPMRLQGLQNNDRFLIDACEFMNAVYEDMSQINDIVSIKKIQTLIPEGVVLFYQGFIVINSLEPKYLSKVH